jgi:hypothetical protein
MRAPQPTPVVCDVAALAEPSLETIDGLARLQLAARRIGREVRLRHASDDLQDLLAFVGLADVLRVEPGGEPEQREQRLGVEEERELCDPPA